MKNNCLFFLYHSLMNKVAKNNTIRKKVHRILEVIQNNVNIVSQRCIMVQDSTESLTSPFATALFFVF